MLLSRELNASMINARRKSGIRALGDLSLLFSLNQIFEGPISWQYTVPSSWRISKYFVTVLRLNFNSSAIWEILTPNSDNSKYWRICFFILSLRMVCTGLPFSFFRDWILSAIIFFATFFQGKPQTD